MSSCTWQFILIEIQQSRLLACLALLGEGCVIGRTVQCGSGNSVRTGDKGLRFAPCRRGAQCQHGGGRPQPEGQAAQEAEAQPLC